MIYTNLYGTRQPHQGDPDVADSIIQPNGTNLDPLGTGDVQPAGAAVDPTSSGDAGAPFIVGDPGLAAGADGSGAQASLLPPTQSGGGSGGSAVQSGGSVAGSGVVGADSADSTGLGGAVTPILSFDGFAPDDDAAPPADTVATQSVIGSGTTSGGGSIALTSGSMTISYS